MTKKRATPVVTTQNVALSIDQVTDLIRAAGTDQTVIVQGPMGFGKTSIGYTLAREMPTHKLCYFDCTTKDVGDIAYPHIAGASAEDTCVRFVPNEELGAHLKQPVLLMLDEIGKNRSIMNPLSRVLLEHKVGNTPLPEGSMVFGTTNLTEEGLGDMVPAHAHNRVTMVTMRKPTALEWIERWALNNGINPVVCGWAREYSQAFHEAHQYSDPDENPYIHHPKSARKAFVTGRSLASAARWLDKREQFDTPTLMAALTGTVGLRAASDMLAYLTVADEMPTVDEIRTNPAKARVPDHPAALCMVVYRTLGGLDREFMIPWMEYLSRLRKETQALFVNGVRAEGYSKAGIVLTSKPFQEFIKDNAYMYV